MHFGRSPTLEGVDFSLPSPRVAWRPPSGVGVARFALRVGAPAWSRPDWVGKLYAEGTPSAAYLASYGAHFGAIELNSSFYAWPSPERVASWCSQVPESFRFCPKLPRAVSHRRGLAVPSVELDRLSASLEAFGARLGPLLLQLPEHVERAELPALLRLLEALPRRVHVAVELRHASWFVERQLHPEVFHAFAAQRVSAVVTDVSGRRDVCHGSLSVPWLFVRFVGDSLAPSDAPRLAAWAERLEQLRTQGLRAAYFFVHQPDDRLAPETGALAGSLFEGSLGLELVKPRLADLPGQLRLL